MIVLYDYWRSTAAYRVRIGLNLKGLEYEARPVNLVKDRSEQRRPDYLEINPQGRVPALAHGGVTVTQSLAILEYIDEKFPAPPLLPEDTAERARARQLAHAIACDIHPLNNISVLTYLDDELGVDEAARKRWYRHWIETGFDALEQSLQHRNWKGPYCLGAQVTLADLCLVPQIYNARRFQIPLDAWPALLTIEDACLGLEAFDRARPENQPDAVK